MSYFKIINPPIWQIPSKFRLILTGTPVQNNLNELYSLLAFVAPDVFPGDEHVCAEFAEHFANATEDKERTRAPNTKVLYLHLHSRGAALGFVPTTNVYYNTVMWMWMSVSISSNS